MGLGSARSSCEIEASLSWKSSDFRHLRILSFNDVLQGRCDEYIRGKARIVLRRRWEVADQWKIHLDLGLGQAEEEERSAIDASLISARRPPDESPQLVLLHNLCELERR